MNAYTQPTIWEVPNDVWTLIEQVLNEVYPAKPKGHRRVELRRVLNGIIFRLRTGCQWNQLPKQFGDDSTVHRHFQRWCDLGVFERIWAVLVQACDELGGVDWPWQAADAAMGKARMGGDLVGCNPTDRGKKHIPPDLVVDRWAFNGESGSYRDFLCRQDVSTMVRHQRSEKRTSTISMAWHFTTKSGGI